MRCRWLPTYYLCLPPLLMVSKIRSTVLTELELISIKPSWKAIAFIAPNEEWHDQVNTKTPYFCFKYRPKPSTLNVIFIKKIATSGNSGEGKWKGISNWNTVILFKLTLKQLFLKKNADGFTVHYCKVFIMLILPPFLNQATPRIFRLYHPKATTFAL